MKNTEEEKFNALFSDFNPEMKSDGLFMSRLENKLTTLDPVKSQLECVHRRNRIAVSVAAITGFIFGIIVAIFYPYITGFISEIELSSTILPAWLGDYVTTLTWSVIGIIGMILMFSAYDIARLVTRRIEN
ncbi:MAG: hypothetical protein K2H98_05350 [Duncaniella sp.]|nr:hypothetical protein [Duncaniella sp.]